MTDRVVELRSDTFTRPTEAMRRAMYEAEVGDDVWNEDPTVHRLEERAAELTGKEDALFVTSGSQGNLSALLSHTRLGNEVIVGDRSHIFEAEAAGAATVGGLQLRQLRNRPNGTLDPDDVVAGIRSEDIHEPPTGCIALENTHNHCGGHPLAVDYVRRIGNIAHQHGIPLHIDGARIFNASVALGVPVTDLTDPADSVTFCLSKGLGAPVGSLLCGSEDFIGRARRWRKMLGGGMRQAGILAAAGLVALDDHIDRLADDHRNARLLAEGLAEIPGVSLDPAEVESNILFFELDPSVDLPRFNQAAGDRGVKLDAISHHVRAVTSSEVSTGDIEYTLHVLAQVIPAARRHSA
ncbi:MAG: low-specificity L-threonine aldolase [Chloroflexota bacterium]